MIHYNLMSKSYVEHFKLSDIETFNPYKTGSHVDEMCTSLNERQGFNTELSH